MSVESFLSHLGRLPRKGDGLGKVAQKTNNTGSGKKILREKYGEGQLSVLCF